MSTTSDAFLKRAHESLAGAASEISNRRYNNGANRAYYACCQAAIAALDAAGVQPPPRAHVWRHAYVQAEFVGLLINRRKRYPATLRNTLRLTMKLRQQGDYEESPVSELQAVRALRSAQELVHAITEREQGGQA